MAGKSEVSFPSLRLSSRQEQKRQQTETAPGKNPLLFIQSSWRFLVGNKLLSVGSKSHLGAGFLFLQEEVVWGHILDSKLALTSDLF